MVLFCVSLMTSDGYLSLCFSPPICVFMGEVSAQIFFQFWGVVLHSNN